ncbi:MAG: YbjN domain-containing protein [Myxococcaceae bacterium]|nr:YbjN domain-containing protein [Myxococcaceae bacterium]
MPGLLETAKAHFDAERWAYDAAKDAPVLKLGFEGKNGRWRCFFEAKEEVQQVVFFSLREGAVPVERRAAVAELCSRINCRLNVGNFELNFNDGMARFRSGVDVEGVGLTPALLKGLTLLNVATMDKYLPALTAVVQGELPLKALGLVAQ